MKATFRASAFAIAAVGLALLAPQTLPAQAPPANGPRPANGPPRIPQLKPDPRVQQKSYTLPTGEVMKYTLYVSSKVKPGVPAPLVVALHGYGGEFELHRPRPAGRPRRAGRVRRRRADGLQLHRLVRLAGDRASAVRSSRRT